MTYHFAVDLGATSGRTILASFDGKKVEMQEVSRFKHPMLPIAGHIYWNLPGLYNEVLEGLKKAKTILDGKGASLASIGIDTWGCDVAFFNADGSLAGLPHCYRDAHTEGAVDKFHRTLTREQTYALTGIQFMDFNTLFQLDTMNRNGSDTLRKADKILFMPDALSYMLTGNAVTEYTVASTSQILNPNTGELDQVLLSEAGVSPDKFGPVVNPGHIIGTLTPQVQEYTGLGAVPVVAVAGHDTASAVIGVPTPDDEYAYLSCGTWSLLGIESKTPIINDASRGYNFTNEGGIDGTTRFLKNICGMWLFERCRAEWTEADAPVNDVVALTAMCNDSECESIINPDDPSFDHPASMTKAIRDYCTKTGQAVPETPADYIRVIFRSLATRYKEVLGWLCELHPEPEVKRLHVIGGGSLNKHLMQMTADTLGIPVVAGPAECTAMGNVLVQLRACGELDSLKAMRQVSAASTETKTYMPEK
ncbi:MAG: rhamnulokinase [Muribaculaceae bacterium]|nr:rhamnulokinase [Muribaculaceae bacterium]